MRLFRRTLRETVKRSAVFYSGIFSQKVRHKRYLGEYSDWAELRMRKLQRPRTGLNSITRSLLNNVHD